jgi:S-formylglutathione hydrolase FrmB
MGFHGYSMGGYGALRLAPIVGRPSVRVVTVLSAAIWRDAGNASTSGFANAAEYEQYTVFGHQSDLDGIAVRLDCGTDDPFYPEDKAYVAGFRRTVTSTFEPGAHDTDYWTRMMPAQLAFAGDALGRPTAR